MYYVTSSILIIFGVFIYFYLDTRVPEPLPEKIQIKITDGLSKLSGDIISGLIAAGLTTPFSSLARRLIDWSYLVQATGVPWGLGIDPHLQITETHMDGVRVRMYQPVKHLVEENRPVLVYFHGGGWSILSTASYDPFLRQISRDSNVVVISVEYRLSPEHPYPTPREDCLRVVEYVIANSDTLGFDPNRIAIGGDSCGGNIAAAISLMPEVSDKLAMQLLLVPVLQVVNWNTSGFIENKHYFHKTLNNPGSIAFVLNYLGLSHKYFDDFISNTHTSAEFKKSHEFLFNMNHSVPKHFIRTETLHSENWTAIKSGNDDLYREIVDKITDPYIWPLMATNDQLEYLPFTYILTSGYDLIRDDGIIFSERLKSINSANIKHSHFSDGFHNSFMFSKGPFKIDVGQRMVHDILDALKTLTK